MSTEKRQWTESEREAASRKIWPDVPEADRAEHDENWRYLIELQCEHTALCEALERLVNEEDNFHPVPEEMLEQARAALSAAQKEKV